MITAKEIVDKVLEEELGFVAEGKRSIVSDRIIKELHLQKSAFLNVDNLGPSSRAEISVCSNRAGNDKPYQAESAARIFKK